MATQEFISNLWTLVPAYKNEAVFQSHSNASTPRSSTTLTPQPSNPKISMGDSVNGYRAPVQLIQVLPPSIPPRFRERNTMNPLKQQQVNLAMEKIAVPDPSREQGPGWPRASWAGPSRQASPSIPTACRW